MHEAVETGSGTTFSAIETGACAQFRAGLPLGVQAHIARAITYQLISAPTAAHPHSVHARACRLISMHDGCQGSHKGRLASW